MINAFQRVTELAKLEKSSKDFRVATVVSVSSGNPTVKFWGDLTACQKKYKRLSSYTPAVDDTVLLVRLDNTYVILGKIQ